MPLDMAPSLGPSQKPETIEIPLELPGFVGRQEDFGVLRACFRSRHKSQGI